MWDRKIAEVMYGFKGPRTLGNRRSLLELLVSQSGYATLVPPTCSESDRTSAKSEDF